jgi:hypothetical protein
MTTPRTDGNYNNFDYKVCKFSFTFDAFVLSGDNVYLGIVSSVSQCEALAIE